MNTTFTPAEILDGVRQDLSECLGVDFEETQPNATFFTDLGGESIDMIDWMFRCEKRFGVRVDLHSLISDLRPGSDGQLTLDSIGVLQARVPEIDWQSRVAAINTSDPRDIMTVDLLSELVRRAIRLNEQQESSCETSSTH